MGPTGAGKSTFIERATRQDGQTVGRGLRSFTEDIRTVRITHPANGHPILLVDTPGFDDTSKSDVEILAMIANFLVKTYKGKANLASIIYLHKISDNRMTGSVLKNLQIFASLCGHKAMPNVVIATTMWGKVSKEEGNEREDELKRDFWREMVANGCRTERFENSHDSAWRIIHSLSMPHPAQVLLPTEIVDDKLRINETAAGVTLNKELEKLIKAQKNASRMLEQQAKRQGNELVVHELNERKVQIDEKILQFSNQLRELKIPFSRKVHFFLNGKGKGKGKGK